jgi:hypothetical protein
MKKNSKIVNTKGNRVKSDITVMAIKSFILLEGSQASQSRPSNNGRKAASL